MKPPLVFALLIISVAIKAAVPRFTVEMTAYRGYYRFYNPAGEIITVGTSEGDLGIIWDGRSERAAELQRANESGDGFWSVGSEGNPPDWPGSWGVMVRRNGVVTSAGSFGGNTGASDINEHGQIVGFSIDRALGYQPFLWDGTLIRLNDLIANEVRFNFAIEITDAGVIYGTRSVDGMRGALVKLTPRPDGRYDAMEMAVVTNQVRFSESGDAIFYRGAWLGGNLRDLGHLGRAHLVYPKGINSASEIVGIAMPTNDMSYHGFYWDGQMYDLTDLVSLPAGWSLPEAEDVNEYGQIAARAYTGSEHKLLRLTPQPKIAGISRGTEWINIVFRPGGRSPTAVNSSTDLRTWTLITNIGAPRPLEQLRIAHDAERRFFRIARSSP